MPACKGGEDRTPPLSLHSLNTEVHIILKLTNHTDLPGHYSYMCM